MREGLARLTLAAASALGGLMLLELAFRGAGVTPDHAPAMARVHDRGWTALLDCYPSNPRGYFSIDLMTEAARQQFQWLAPQRYDSIARRAPYAVAFHYNGLRLREQPPKPKVPGRTRVVVVGDSFTEGQGVNEPDTYVRVLESGLNAAEPGLWETRNSGRRATDFPALAAVFEAGLQYDPDIVVYAMVLNDADRSPEFQARQRYVNDWILDHTRIQDGLPEEPPLLHSQLWGFVQRRWAEHSIGRASTRWYQDMYGVENALGWARTRQHIQEMHVRTRAGGGRFAVVLWPLLVDFRLYPFDAAHQAIRRYCEAEGIPFLDLLPTLGSRDAASLWVHPLDHHPNEIAHRLAAEALVPVVQRLR